MPPYRAQTLPMPRAAAATRRCRIETPVSIIKWNPTGVMREVLLSGRWAVKLPKLTRGWRNFLQGLLATGARHCFANG
jgi:hypothetical protein